MHAYSVPVPDGFDDKVAQMFQYAAYCPMPNGDVPLLGASVTLSTCASSSRRSSQRERHRRSGQHLRDWTMPRPSLRMFGPRGRRATRRRSSASDSRTSGQSFLRAAFGPTKSFDESTWMSFNAGVWRNAHCHLDALAVTYYSNGIALMPDSGLYEYDSESNPIPAAEYFSGTSAHNTVVVDGTDQSNAPAYVKNVVGGLATTGDGWEYQSASHQLYKDVTHARSVFLLAQDVALVLDTLSGDDMHAYTQTWHLWPDANIAPAGLDVVATGSDGNGGTAALALHQGVTDGVTLATAKGQTVPVIQGFYSDEYEQQVPSYALEYTQQATSAHFATLIASGPLASSPAVLKTDFDAAGNVSVTVCVGTVKSRCQRPESGRSKRKRRGNELDALPVSAPWGTFAAVTSLLAPTWVEPEEASFLGKVCKCRRGAGTYPQKGPRGSSSPAQPAPPFGGPRAEETLPVTSGGWAPLRIVCSFECRGNVDPAQLACRLHRQRALVRCGPRLLLRALYAVRVQAVDDAVPCCLQSAQLLHRGRVVADVVNVGHVVDVGERDGA